MPQKKLRPGAGDLRIGYLLTRIAEPYQGQIWPGVADRARGLGVNLLCFAGGSMRSPYRFDAQRNVLYRYIGPQNVDGLIITPGSLGNYVGDKWVAELCRRYTPLPMVSIGVPFADSTYLQVNNYCGMQGLMTHLLEVHGFRRLAFISGTPGHQEGEARRRAFLEALAAHGLEASPELMANGEFTRDGAAAALQRLVQEHGLDFDAIVACNDDMALGVMEVLASMGVRVPEQIAVAGFDCIDEGQLHPTPLTTVEQPLYELGARSIELLVAKLRGEQTPPHEEWPARLIVRRSCGCTMLRDWIFAPEAAAPRGDPAPDGRCGPLHDPAEAEKTADGLSQADCEELSAILALEIDGQAQGAFLFALAKMLRRTLLHGQNVAAWHDALAGIRRQAAASHGEEALARLADLWQEAGALVTEAAFRPRAYHGLRVARCGLILNELSQQIVSMTTREQLVETLARTAPQIGLKRLYLSLYDEEDEGIEQARLIFAWDQRGRLPLPAGGQLFPTASLLPDGILPPEERSTLLVEPLFYSSSDQLGFVLFEPGLTEGVIYEMLSGQISSALKAIILFQEKEAALERLAHKADELAGSNKELEQFAFVASHDLQEPLRMIHSYLGLLEKRYSGSLDDGAKEFIAFAMDGAVRMQRLISDLLTYSRVGTRGKEFTPIQAGVALDQALANLQAAVEETGAIIKRAELPSVMADETQLIQVFQNLIGNAIKFHGPRSPEVSIRAVCKNGMWEFAVQDNGIGIPAEYLERIFLLFQRLHQRDEYPGTGIGLAVCKRIVERHGGRLWVESETGTGSTFYFTLPMTKGGSS